MKVLLRTMCVLFVFLAGSMACQFFPTAVSWAAINCYQCHGTSSPDDYRPVDAPYRNITTGGFVGNHRTHMDSPASPAACSSCHPASTSNSSAHRDGKIKLSSHINSSLPATTYKNVTSAFPQTSTPAPGTCANVNCHFESPTPTWGNNPALTTCSTCHGAPPGDGSHPAASGSGRKHGDYYGTTTSCCAKCHADHTSEPNPFAHATSAGKRGLIVSFASVPNNGSGSYSGTTSYPNYLPSSSPSRNGSCSATYCHSPGTKSTGFSTPNQTASWGGTLGCTGCHLMHDDPYTDYPPGSEQSHVRHTTGGARVTVPCYKCHVATVTPGITISSTANHVNGHVDVAFNNTTTAALNAKYKGYSAIKSRPSVSAAGNFGTCVNVYCHSVQNNGGWGLKYSTPTWDTSASGKCGTCHDAYQPHGGAQISSGSHTKHFSYGFTGGDNKCAVCHYGNSIDFSSGYNCGWCHTHMNTLHVNGKVDIS